MVGQAEIIPYVMYRDVPAALAWLTDCLGFTEDMRHETPSGGMHAEMTLGGQRIMLGGRANTATPAQLGGTTQGVFIYLDDVAAHYDRAARAGAKIDAPPTDHGYGATYTAHDPEGHPWYITQRPAEA